MKKLILVMIFSFSLISNAQVEETQGNSNAKQAKETPSQTKKDSSQEANETNADVINWTAMKTIKDLDQKIDSYKTGKNLSAEDQEYNRNLKSKILRGTFDIYELAKLALDVHWDSLTDVQRSDFVELMTTLLEKKAIFSREQVKSTDKPYNIRYTKEKFLNKDKSQAMVETALSVPSEKVTLNIHYKMIFNKEKGWKIFDVIVDDASLLENYRFQFNAIITKYGYPELVNRMQKKLKAIGPTK